MPAESVTIRMARAEDADRVANLAALDSAPAPEGRVLLAEVGEDLWAALSLEDCHAVGDPFHPTGELVFLLVERGRQLRRHEQRRTRRGLMRRRRPALA